MDVAELLKKYETPDPVKRFREELLEVYEDKKTHPLLDKETTEIGLVILNALPGLRKETNHWEIIKPVELRDERVKLLRFTDPAPGRVVGLAWRRTSPRKADFSALGQLITDTLGVRANRSTQSRVSS